MRIKNPHYMKGLKGEFMKVLKKALQRNFQINKEMYTERQLKEMCEKHLIFWLNPLNGMHTDFNYNDELTDYRIPDTFIKEIKVIYNKMFGFYETVAILENDLGIADETIHIII